MTESVGNLPISWPGRAVGGRKGGGHTLPVGGRPYSPGREAAILSPAGDVRVVVTKW
jgi:hypothetical protein